MSKAEEQRRRDSLRLPSWDYTFPAWYFITICTKNRPPFFGDILDDEIRLSWVGRIVEEEWNRIPSLRPHVILDEWVVMPNHLHGIVILQGVSARASRRDAPTKAGLKPGSLGAIVNHFKSNCTKRIRAAGSSTFAWQRGYYDHIIRDEIDRSRIRRYIRQNPLKWSLDPYHCRD